MRNADRSYRICVLTIYACLINSHLITITMIRKNALLCKLIRIKTSSKFIFDSYMDNYQPQQEICPFCKSQGNCRIHAYYNRSVIDFRYGHKVKSSLCVQRLICDSCGHTHAVLPDSPGSGRILSCYNNLYRSSLWKIFHYFHAVL